jgi:small-conductance mechanosensitive channel
MAFAAQAQEEAKEPTAEPTAPPPVEKIAATAVPERAATVSATLRQIRERISPESDVDEVMRLFEERNSNLEEQFNAPELSKLDYQSARMLDNLNQTWIAERNQLSEWARAIQKRVEVLSGELVGLRALAEPWQLTLDQQEADELPDAIADRVRSTLADIDSTIDDVRKRRNILLTAQNTLSEQSVRIDEILDNVRNVQTRKEVRILATDSPPLWLMFSRAETAGEPDVTDQVESSWDRSLDLLLLYLEAHDDQALGQLLLFLILATTLAITKRRRKSRTHDESRVETQIDVLSFPIASSLLLVLPLTGWFYADPPSVLMDFSKLALALPMFLLLRQVIRPEMRVPFYLALFLYILDMAGNIAFTRPLPERLSLITESVLGLTGLIWVLRSDGFLRTQAAGRWWQAITLAARVSATALAIAIVVNLIGAVSLADLLSSAVLTSAYFGFGLYALNLVLKSMLETFLGSHVARSINALRRHPEAFRKRIIWFVNLGAVIVWLTITLRSIGVFESTIGGLIALITTPVTVGTIEVSLGDVLSFIVALWLGAKIARFVQFSLEEDVYPRVRMPRGVPSTITMMVRYGIFTIAFLLGLAAAGIELGKFTILAGAVGIGVGFGMQNIINNFVSGLILAFERPIQPGDTVEMGTLFGRVRKIGVRASVVRTYTGAEVIVPNGNLISQEVINWTLSDPHRRLELPIGVAYGTDPHKVIEVLKKVAYAHPAVLEAPEPDVAFRGFGNSSLDFELRAWIGSFDETVIVRTDLNLGICDALAEAGIEIPFPQRDLHLRSVDASIGARMLSDPEISEPQVKKEKKKKKFRPRTRVKGEGEPEFGGDIDGDGDGDGGDGY